MSTQRVGLIATIEEKAPFGTVALAQREQATALVFRPQHGLPCRRRRVDVNQEG